VFLALISSDTNSIRDVKVMDNNVVKHYVYPEVVENNEFQVYLNPRDLTEWSLFAKVVSDFLETEEEYLAVIHASYFSAPEVILDYVRQLSLLNLGPLDLFQLSYRSRWGKLIRPVFYSNNPFIDLGKIIGRNLVSFDLVYRNWLTFTRVVFLIQKKLAQLFYDPLPSFWIKKISRRLLVSQQSILSGNERELRKFFLTRSPLVFHSFERGIEAFIISRRFSTYMLSINNPPLLNLNELLSGIARTQNLVALRLAKRLGRSRR
jgi:hypothetical protein